MHRFFRFFTEGLGYTQSKRGGIDKYDPINWKKMWQGIIDSIHSQLPREYRNLRYLGPIPPTDAPLYSPKRSDQVQKIHLFFGRHKHDRTDRIRVEAGRTNSPGDRMNWKVLSISRN